MTAFARRARLVQQSAIREFLALAGDPAITSFAGGYPDPTLFPVDELHKIFDELLTPTSATPVTSGTPVVSETLGMLTDFQDSVSRSPIIGASDSTA